MVLRLPVPPVHGRGFGTRTLSENDEETLFEAMRPAALNGITDVATRADLLDRAVVVELPVIPKKMRKKEKKLWKEFEEALPGILGGLFDALSAALRELPNTELASLPRMADAALWVTAAEGRSGGNRGRSWTPTTGAARKWTPWRWNPTP